MKRAIVIGASSGIGRQVASLLIQQGWHVGIAARRVDKLEELRLMAPDRVEVAAIDVTAEDAVARLHSLIDAIDGVRLFFYAAGIGYMNRDLDANEEVNTARTNAVGFITIVGEAYRYMVKNGGGHIAVISSIAGTKGLGPAPAYSATKALQSTYIEALEQQAHRQGNGIRFTDIRPGFVDTPLLSGNSFPMTMSQHHVAKHIIRAISKNRHVVIIDWRWHVVTTLWRMLPHWLWRRMNI